MKVPEEELKKFPVIIRNKFNKEIEFQDEVEFEYKNIIAYRCVTRKKEDSMAITKEDFKSNAERERRNIRGESGDIEKKPEYYGVSLFEDKAQLEIRLQLPKRNKKIAKGEIYCGGGPILKGKDTHICWWLYENADVTGFKIENSEET